LAPVYQRPELKLGLSQYRNAVASATSQRWCGYREKGADATASR